MKALEPCPEGRPEEEVADQVEDSTDYRNNNDVAAKRLLVRVVTHQIDDTNDYAYEEEQERDQVQYEYQDRAHAFRLLLLRPLQFIPS